jgi:hypothetical protein
MDHSFAYVSFLSPQFDQLARVKLNSCLLFGLTYDCGQWISVQLLGPSANRLPQLRPPRGAYDENTIVVIYQENERRPTVRTSVHVEIELIVTIKEIISILDCASGVKEFAIFGWWGDNL